MTITLLLSIGLALVVSLGLNRAMLALAPRLGLMDEPGERRIHTQVIPRAGGLAIWLSFLIVIGGGLATGIIKPAGHLSWPWFTAFAAGSTVLMVAGILDDRGGLRPLVKLGAHALAPTVFFLLHPVHTGLFPAGWHWSADCAVLVIWAVMLINAFNLIDGLDGLCGGLSAVALAALTPLAMMNGRWGLAQLMLVMLGALVGFLKYNRNPARIFLGDAGSMLMGFFLAVAATDAAGRKALLGVILLPIAVAGVPLLDVLLAVWRRSARRIIRQLRGEDAAGGIFDADSDHLHHRLLASGNSQRKVSARMQCGALVMAGLAFMPMIFGDQLSALSIVGLLVLGMVGIKNLAHIEIVQTGSMAHLVIKMPDRRRRFGLLLFFYDILALAAAATAAVLIETNGLMHAAEPHRLLRFVVVSTACNCLGMVFSRAYQRLWVRHSLRDLVSLQTWVFIGTVATFALFSLMDDRLEWSVLRLAVMSLVFSGAGVILPRIALEMCREMALEAQHCNKQPAKGTGDGQFGPMVVLGAGNLGTLLVFHLKTSVQGYYPGLRLLGFIDEDRSLHGLRLRSFPVLGGLSEVPRLVAENGLRGIIVAIDNPREGLMDELNSLAARYQLKIHRWHVGLGKMVESGATAKATRNPNRKTRRKPRSAAVLPRTATLR